ncbi:MAG TPA: hypothetical protein VGS28_02750 [Candidatus Saccharimonadales bacterium]|nr:hypothetical protein [Candidatus Saccharimonadales bacterium]
MLGITIERRKDIGEQWQPTRFRRHEVRHPVGYGVTMALIFAGALTGAFLSGGPSSRPSLETVVESGTVSCGAQQLAGIYAVGKFVHLDERDGGRIGLFQFPVTTPTSVHQRNVIARIGCFRAGGGRWGITDQISLPLTTQSLSLVCDEDRSAPRIAQRPGSCQESLAA